MVSCFGENKLKKSEEIWCVEEHSMKSEKISKLIFEKIMKSQKMDTQEYMNLAKVLPEGLQNIVENNESAKIPAVILLKKRRIIYKDTLGNIIDSSPYKKYTSDGKEYIRLKKGSVGEITTRNGRMILDFEFITFTLKECNK